MKSSSFPKWLAVIIIISSFNLTVNAQFSCVTLDAGADVMLDCTTPCTDLTATYIGEPNRNTSSYLVQDPTCPLPPINGGTPTGLVIDDQWSAAIPLGFEFTYYQNTYTDIVVGANGQIAFDTALAGTANGWNSEPGDLLPTTTANFPLNTVYGAYHDIDPSVNGDPMEINFFVSGTAPFRQFVLNFDMVPQFQCNDLLTSQQIVLYESLNVIEVNIIDKPVCATWNDGLATLGIMGNDLTEFAVAPGRNTGAWAATDETWRFLPNGPPDAATVYTWTDPAGMVVGTGPMINVCPSGGSTTYTVTVTFTLPDGSTGSISDDVVVTSVASFAVDLGPDIDTCDTTPIVLDASADAPAGTIYEWFFNGANVAGPSPAVPTLTVTAPNSGTYSVEAFDPADPTCVTGDSIDINFGMQPAIASPPLNLFICDDGATPGIFDLTSNTPIVLGGQDPLEFTVKYYESFLDSQNDTAQILPPGDAMYAIMTPPMQTIYLRIEDSSGSCFELAEFTLTYASAVAGMVADVTICDQDGSGDEPIDLNTFTTDVLNGADPLEFNVTYHANQADADADMNPLPFIYDVTAPSELIIIRLENDDNPTCFDTTQSFTVFVDSPPTTNTMPATLVVCDVDNDGFSTFGFADAIIDIQGGDPTLVVTFHETLLDAQTNENPLADPYDNVDAYNQTVFARVESPTSTCYTTVELELEVRNTPEVVAPADPLRICDDNFDGFQVFDMTVVEAEVLDGNDPLMYDIFYYEDPIDAMTAGESALTPMPDFSGAIVNPGNFGNTVPNAQTIYILVVGNMTNTMPNNGGFGCYTIVELELIVDPLPVAVEPMNFELCDDEINGSTSTDQISTFDLTNAALIAEVTGGDTDLSVTWYETVADEAADVPIAMPEAYQNTAIPPAPLNPQTIIGRVTNQFGCSVTVTLTLVVNPNPSPVTPTPLEVCDEDNDGFALFTLTDKDIEIIGGEPGVFVNYYGTLALAEIGDVLDALASPYANDDAFNDMVWARVENAMTGCFTVVVLDLIVNQLPDAPTADFGDLLSCDEDGDLSAEFDLTQNTPFVLGGQPATDFTVTYHESLADADAGTPVIPNPTMYVSAGQTIWVRIENNMSDCYLVSEFELVVGAFPIIAAPADVFLCDDEIGGSTQTDETSTFDLTANDDFITVGDPDLTVFYYETAADQAANNFIDPATAYQNTDTPQTLFVSVFNTAGCEAQTTITLVVDPVPSPAQPTPLEVCDEDNDGVAMFTLTDKDAEIINGEAGVIVSYHLNQADAENNVFPLASPYENVFSPVQPVFARVEFDDTPPATGTGCFTVVVLDLVVLPTPVVPLTIDPIVICDDDGTATFDLTLRESDIFGTQSPLDYTLTYHESQADADAGTPFIATPQTYINMMNPQDIFVRLEDNTSRCFSTGTFQIEANLGPVVTQPLPFEQCDDLGMVNDGITTFDLTTQNATITGGVAGLSVTYYTTQADADAGTNAIDPDTAYVNQVNGEVVFVRVVDSNTECVDTSVTLTLVVNPNPQPVTPTPLELCDDDMPGDGMEVFDLTQAQAEILNGNTTFDVLYYENQADALGGDPLLAIAAADLTNYTNMSNPQIIYVRVTNPASGCFELVELQLIVNPLPDDTASVEDYIICEIGTDGQATFDLTTKDGEILNGQDPLVFVVTYYEDMGDAVAGVNALTLAASQSYENDITLPSPPGQAIYFGIENTVTGCYIGGNSFNLQVLEGATATAPSSEYVICDNEGANDGFALFDLTDTSDPEVAAILAEILGAQSAPGYDLTFHESIDNAMDGTGAITFPYMNVINPQEIYARVTNTTTDCFDVTSLILKVEQLPDVTLDETYRLCVDENGLPIAEEFGTTSPPTIDTGLDPTLYAFEWTLNGEVLVGQIGSSIVAVEGGVYTVTYTEIATGCSNTVETTVTVSSAPTTFSAEVVTGAFANEHTIVAMAEGLGEYEFSLDDGAFQSDGTFTDVLPGDHIITIQDINGCGTVIIEVGVVDYPRFFTPNEDGYHDTWNIIGIASADPTAKIYIFDRGGKLLKQISPLSNGWDGSYNGNPLPSSDYWFRIEYTENDRNKEFKGHFTLKR